MADAGAAAVVEHADAVAFGKGFAGICLLGDGHRPAAVEADFDFDALAAAHRLLGVGSGHGSDSSSGDGGHGPACAAADLVAKNSTGHSTEDGAGGGAAFDFHVADRGDPAVFDGLGLACFAARVGVAGKALLGA